MFGRRKNEVAEVSDGDVDAFVDDLTPEERAQEDAELAAQLEADERRAVASPQGPWDSTEAPAGERIDLGALLVAVFPGVDVRLEVNPEGQVAAVTMVSGESAAQLNVFAAPRSEGIWGEVCTEIRDALTEGGGRAEQVEGPFGMELQASVPEQQPDGSRVLRPARFLGVDGPRWFLRALLTGPAARDQTAAQPLLEAFRQVVVVRGTDPMPAREALPLRLPADMPLPEAAPESDSPTLTLPGRGPEITEVR